MGKISTTAKYVGLALMTLIMLFPLYTVFIMGTYYSEEIFRGLPVTPSDYLMENLKTVMSANFGQSFFNSLFVSLSALFLSVTTSSLVGFAVAKYEFKMKKFLTAFILATLMIPGQISTIGFVREMRTFGLLTTHIPLVVIWIASPFGAFFMIQFMRDSVPTELMESARLDGCSEPYMFAKIIAPLIKPAYMTLATLIFVQSWNSYMLPLIVINKQEMFTIPLMISNLSNAFRTDYGAIMCALSMGVLPMILLFIICSKTFIKGIAAGAVKG